MTEYTEKSIRDSFLDTHRPAEKTFSAIHLGSELLVNYLERTSTPIRLEPDLLDRFFRDSYSAVSQIPEVTLENGWRIIASRHFLDSSIPMVGVPSVLATTRILDMRGNPDHPIALELGVLSWMYYKAHRVVPESIAIIIDKLFTHYRPMPTEQLNIIEMEVLHPVEVIEQMLIDRTTALDLALQKKKAPEKCTTIRFHRQNGNTVNMSCTHYCHFRDSCPHVGKKSYSRAKTTNLIF